jgi:hypothetical protein
LYDDAAGQMLSDDLEVCESEIPKVENDTTGSSRADQIVEGVRIAWTRPIMRAAPRRKNGKTEHIGRPSMSW